MLAKNIILITTIFKNVYYLFYVMSQDKNKTLEGLTSFDIMQYVIAATISSFQPGTWFYTSKEGLREGLERVYGGVDNSFIKKNRFRESINPKNDFVRLHLSATCFYGTHIGLTNWGFDHDYYIDPKLKNVRDNVLNEARDVLGEKDFNFFRELGNSLISD